MVVSTSVVAVAELIDPKSRSPPLAALAEGMVSHTAAAPSVANAAFFSMDRRETKEGISSGLGVLSVGVAWPFVAVGRLNSSRISLFCFKTSAICRSSCWNRSLMLSAVEIGLVLIRIEAPKRLRSLIQEFFWTSTFSRLPQTLHPINSNSRSHPKRCRCHRLRLY
jgi:hypothetical protein